MGTENGIRVAVCVLTYRRPELLRSCLAALDRLLFTRVPECRPIVLVVENEADGPGAAVCGDAGLRHPLHYIREPKPGISHARNSAIREALKSSDYVAFLDDDETPAPNWLDNLLFALLKYEADAVCGPVLPVYAISPPSWIQDGKFFERPRFPSGTRLADGRTGNVLLRSSALHGLAPVFDCAFSTSGGEDTEFFMRLHRSGRVLIWEDDACVYETVPPERASLRWILHRAFQGGNAFTFVLLSTEPGCKPYLGRASAGIGRILSGIAALPFSLFRGPSYSVKALQAISLGAGTLAGLGGYRKRAYHDRNRAGTPCSAASNR